MKRLTAFAGTFGLAVVAAMPAAANLGAYGKVYCDVDGDGSITEGVDSRLSGVSVDVEGDLGFTNSDVTQSGESAHGTYNMALSLEVPQTYTLSVDESTIPGGGVVIQPATSSYMFTATAVGQTFTRDFLVDSPACLDEPVDGCWMTAGGVKFSAVLGMDAAQHGPKNSFGGNVFPSCSSEPGDGGQWNHVDHANQLHFQGFSVDAVSCGNVPGIEPGSESPVTPFNYIEFSGTGRVQGIKGNKLRETDVSFFARVEDRNEPGNEHAAAGEDVDRYFLHVFSDAGNPIGTTILLTDVDGDASTVDPLTITGGNLQLHSTSCD